MFSETLNWIGRLCFAAGSFLGILVLVGQCFQWLRTAEWISTSFERGAAAIYLPGLRCSWLGVQLIFDYINAAPFSVTIFVFGFVLFFLFSWLSNKIPSKWEPQRKVTGAS
jgi:hypothetical protein